MFPGFWGGYVSLAVRRIDLLFWQGVPIARGTLPVDAIEFFLSQVAGAHFLDLARSLCCIKAWQSAAAVMQRIAMPLEILGVLVTWFCHRQALWLERGLRRGTAQHSLARHSTAPHSNARRNAAKHKQLGETRHSTTRHSTAHHSTSHHILGHFGPTSARMESHTTAPHSRQCERRTGRCAKALAWRYLQGLGEVG